MSLTSYYLFAILTLVSVPAIADESNCEQAFAKVGKSRIDYGQNFSVTRRFIPGSIEAHKAKVAELEKIKVSDIFPNSQPLKIGFDTSVDAVNANMKRILKFRKFFDQLMDERVEAGLIPRQDVKQWRKWLAARQEGNEYPDITNPDLVKYLNADETFASYLDIQFTNYVREAKKIPTDKIPVYLANQYPHIHSRLVAYLARGGKWVVGAGGIVATGMGTYFTVGAAQDITKGVVSPFFETGKAKVAKEGSDKITDVVNKFTVFGPDDFLEKTANLSLLNLRLAEEDFGASSRAKTREKLDDLESSFMKSLPDFRDVVQAIDKSFDEKWTAALKEKLTSLPSLRNNYDTRRAALDTLLGFVENRGTPASDDELDRIATWGAKVKEAEEEIADALVAWQFYRLNRGPKEKLDPVWDQEYGKLYTDYVKMMDVPRYRKKLAAAIEPLIGKLENWKKASSGSKNAEKPLPAPGQLPSADDLKPTGSVPLPKVPTSN